MLELWDEWGRDSKREFSPSLSRKIICGRQIKQMLIVYAAFLKIMLFKFKFSFCLACDSNVPFILVKVFILIGTLKLKQV